ncbi:hypothetical protein [Actinosynnema pretiosum]|uniref:Condensation domain-containing protein n=1 Tax=Actinosynnema pretiosum TaxID=42197 RepID=A0A290Z9V3_9PSEU|nr:hypothetical protein [Actinosynnema pretiosum]ATE55765.1 hypothetical protein CNX65_22820 [Actinosynnema pretiosum]
MEITSAEAPERLPLTAAELYGLASFQPVPTELLHRISSWPLPDVARARAVVDAVVERHAVLRSRIVVGEGGALHREIDPVASPPLVELDDGQEPGSAVAAAVRSDPIRLEEEWPARWYLLRAPSNGGTRLGFVVHHVAAGDKGVTAVVEEVDRLLAGQAPAEPLALADWVRLRSTGACGERAARGALFVQEAIRSSPSLVFTDRGRRVPLPAWLPDGLVPSTTATSRSAALADRLLVLGERWRVPESVILLAALSGALSDLLGVPELHWRSLVDLAGPQQGGSSVVAYEPHGVLLRADASTGSLERRAKALAAQSMRAMRHLWTGDDVLVEAAHAESVRRGAHVDLPLWFNFALSRQRLERLVAGRARAVGGPAVEVITEARFARPGGREIGVFAAGQDERVRVDLYTHHTGVSGAAARSLLRVAHEEIMDSCLGRESRERRARAAAVARGRLFRGAAPGPSVAAPDSGGAVVETAEHATGVLDVPGASMTTVTPKPVRPASAGALRALLDAVRSGSALTRPDPERSFLGQGASIRDIPSVMGFLRARGWRGVTTFHLQSHHSLARLAPLLKRDESREPRFALLTANHPG